jgi:uncharacterized protein YbcI
MTLQTEDQQSANGTLTAAISNAVVRRTAEYTGRGPTKARTIFRDDVVLVILQDILTKGERALVAHDREHKVIELRGEFQNAMGPVLRSDIERLTGRKVIAFMSANHIDPDMGGELFILEPLPLTAPQSRPGMVNGTPAPDA